MGNISSHAKYFHEPKASGKGGGESKNIISHMVRTSGISDLLLLETFSSTGYNTIFI